MFTGIIEGIGALAAIERREGEATYVLTTPWAADGLALGDSVAINGVCLTVTKGNGGRFSADLSRETLDRTTLGALVESDAVNLERAVTPTTRLGGHLVSGHVDGVGVLEALWDDGTSRRMRFRAPSELARYIAVKGSVCLDGVSLTVNAVGADTFEVNIIPHTLTHTTLGGYRQGRQVNIEVDVVARYLERLLQAGVPAETSGGRVTRELLQQHGYISPESN